ncbi:gibberellin 3-beta-dioxygenase 1-like [Magnolia sinica]|uniref:gibberellin 3-beta-dioxygenase 1-like n=1 Tax=Magnolia sinica TaxID=86752 RepID=UPI0026598DD3|nr:gibberellin 3-beta-dioxygenase 1-like [Magnolia sinica]
MPSLSEALGAYPAPLRSSHIDFDSVQKVPDSHNWPRSGEYPSCDLVGDSVPIIDMVDPDVVSHMGHACEKWGVFQIINHGVPMSLLQKVESQAQRLFSLPIEQKLKGIRGSDQTGYGIPPVSSFYSKYMWAEGFTIVKSPVDSVRRIWPDGYQEFCDVMEEYKKEMRLLATKLLWVMLASLGITKDNVPWVGSTGELEKAAIALQMNWYPVCPEPDRCMGLVEHTDSPLITILLQSSNISGLEILLEDNGQPKWVTVHPIDGALAVNVGDLLHVFTNGRFKSVLHRVLVNHTRPRFSIAHFLGPPTGAPISPCPKLVGPDRPPLYGSVTWDEYISVKAKRHNEALSSIRLPASPLKDHNLVEAI